MNKEIIEKKGLTPKDLFQFKKDLSKRPENKVISRAVMKNGVNGASEDIKEKRRLHREFSLELKTSDVTNQKQSGRCWEFALLNTLRHQFEKNHQVKNFELSENYLFFWDRVERANTFYHQIIDTANRPLNDREIENYLQMVAGDGGQWQMAAAIVEKYGVVPNYVMPETFNTNQTHNFDSILALKMKKDALILRNLVSKSRPQNEILAKQKQMVSEVYQMTAYSFGEPPSNFDVEYTDINKKFHTIRNLNPQIFFQNEFNINLEDYVVISNSPDKPFNKLYRLPSQENVINGKQIKFLNSNMETLKRAAIKQLQHGETVWFGNDVLQQSNRKKGFLDSKLYRYSELFGLDLKITKAQRLKTHQAQVSHAMVLTGVNIKGKKPDRWKVENSWGNKNGDNGYFVMTDDWMNDFVYEVVIRKNYLTPIQRKVLQQKPVILEPWDPLA